MSQNKDSAPLQLGTTLSPTQEVELVTCGAMLKALKA